MSFNWEKVEGYKDDMSAEEKLALLDNYEEAAPESKPGDKYVSKAKFDQVSSELAGLKKELRSRMTKDEQDAEDRKAAETEMKSELEQLRKEKTMASYKANYLAQGYAEDLADLAATAMVEGDMESMFAIMKKHSSNAEKSLREQILKETPVPPAGNDSDKEALKKKEDLNKIRVSMGLPPLK